MARRGSRPGKQQGLIWRKAAQHGQIWVSAALTQAVPDLTAKPSVCGLCDTHQGQVSNDDIGRASPSSAVEARARATTS